jgi:uncharacterized membrane protein
MLKEENNVTVINVAQPDALPKTVNELRMFDEVILCNVANKDLPAGLDKLLYSYVYDFGGGLFTVCGTEEGVTAGSDNWTANAYTRDDMYGTLYQEMLPVEIINYTPPAAVMIIIDTSGSMYDSSMEYEGSKLAYAIQGAESCLDALTERDFVGIMTLADNYSEEIKLTPRPQRDKILGAIATLEEAAKNGETGGGTIFSAALQAAGTALDAQDVEKKHIIIVTDGEPAATDEEDFKYWFEQNRDKGITTSIVGIQCSSAAVRRMTDILIEHAGMTEENFHDVDEVSDTPGVMYDDLNVKEIKEVNYEEFDVKLNVPTSPIFNGIEIDGSFIFLDDDDKLSLDGFYGVKPKDGATVILSGTYTPIYTEWQFGKGTVGSFACDLNGTWSSEFINTEQGNIILKNIVKNIFPKENIKPQDIDAEWSGDNYTTQLNVFTTLGEGEYVEATVTSPGIDGADPTVQVLTAGAADGYSRMVFSITTPGMHEIVVCKKDKDGNILSETTVYKPLSYSKEYDVFVDMEEAKNLSEFLATASGGEVIVDPVQVFQNAVKFLHIVIDPKIAFMIAIIVLFLLDIAARKFKWKWPHEIIKDKKAKAMQSSK